MQAASNLLLKTYRSEVPRKRKVHTLVVLVALASTLTALALQIVLSTVILVYFVIFFAIFCEFSSNFKSVICLPTFYSVLD